MTTPAEVDALAEAFERGDDYTHDAITAALREYAALLRAREAGVTDEVISNAQAVVFGLRRKGADAIIGLLLIKVAERPPTSPEFLEQYEKVALYTAPPATSADAQKCPFVVTSGEGTSHCSLAEKDAQALARVRAQLPVIRAKTGNALFDAGANDACDRIERALGETKC